MCRTNRGNSLIFWKPAAGFAQCGCRLLERARFYHEHRLRSGPVPTRCRWLRGCMGPCQDDRTAGWRARCASVGHAGDGDLRWMRRSAETRPGCPSMAGSRSSKPNLLETISERAFSLNLFVDVMLATRGAHCTGWHTRALVQCGPPRWSPLPKICWTRRCLNRKDGPSAFRAGPRCRNFPQRNWLPRVAFAALREPAPRHRVALILVV